MNAEEKCEQLLEEYLESYDEAEAAICVRELPNHDASYALLVQKVEMIDIDSGRVQMTVLAQAVLVGVEKKEQQRDLLARLFGHLHSTNVLTTDHFARG